MSSVVGSVQAALGLALLATFAATPSCGGRRVARLELRGGYDIYGRGKWMTTAPPGATPPPRSCDWRIELRFGEDGSFVYRGQDLGRVDAGACVVHGRWRYLPFESSGDGRIDRWMLIPDEPRLPGNGEGRLPALRAVWYSSESVLFVPILDLQDCQLLSATWALAGPPRGDG